MSIVSSSNIDRFFKYILVKRVVYSGDSPWIYAFIRLIYSNSICTVYGIHLLFLTKV